MPTPIRRASDTLLASSGDNSAAVQIPRDPLPVAPDLGALTGVIGTRLARTQAPQTAIKLMMHGCSYPTWLHERQALRRQPALVTFVAPAYCADDRAGSTG
jgi:hypothetical protein